MKFFDNIPHIVYMGIAFFLSCVVWLVSGRDVNFLPVVIATAAGLGALARNRTGGDTNIQTGTVEKADIDLAQKE